MKQNTSPCGFSLIELMVVVAAIATAAAIGMPVLTSIRKNAHNAHVNSSLGTLNSAVKAYITNGGEIPSGADIETVIAKLKTVRKQEEGETTVVAFAGSFIDPRLQVEQDKKNELGIRWNADSMRFERAFGDDRYHILWSDEPAEVVEEERNGGSFAWGEDWIWTYGEVDPTVIKTPTMVSLVPEPEVEEFEFTGPTIKISGAPNGGEATELVVGHNAAVNPGFEGPNGINDRHQTWSHHGHMAWTTDQGNVEGWNTTASDGMIEIWQSGFSGVDSYSGNFHVEFNANEVSSLWQAVDVSDMDFVNISFAHGQRVRSAEQLRLMVGTNAPATKDHKNHGNGPGNGQGEDLEAQGMTEIMRTDTDAVGGWEFYTDVYAVPEGATTLYFAFQSIGEFAGNSYGNFLDDVKFEAVSRATLEGLEAQIVAGNSISNVIRSGKVRLEQAEVEDDLSLNLNIPGLSATTEYGDGFVEIAITGKASRTQYAQLLETVAFSTTSLETHDRIMVFTLNDGFVESDPVQYLIEFETPEE